MVGACKSCGHLMLKFCLNPNCLESKKAIKKQKSKAKKAPKKQGKQVRAATSGKITDRIGVPNSGHPKLLKFLGYRSGKGTKTSDRRNALEGIYKLKLSSIEDAPNAEYIAEFSLPKTQTRALRMMEELRERTRPSHQRQFPEATSQRKEDGRWFKEKYLPSTQSDQVSEKVASAPPPVEPTQPPPPSKAELASRQKEAAMRAARGKIIELRKPILDRIEDVFARVKSLGYKRDSKTRQFDSLREATMAEDLQRIVRKKATQDPKALTWIKITNLSHWLSSDDGNRWEKGFESNDEIVEDLVRRAEDELRANLEAVAKREANREKASAREEETKALRKAADEEAAKVKAAADAEWKEEMARQREQAQKADRLKREFRQQQQAQMIAHRAAKAKAKAAAKEKADRDKEEAKAAAKEKADRDKEEADMKSSEADFNRRHAAQNAHARALLDKLRKKRNEEG